MNFSGLLERPILPNVEEVSYKLFFVGKSGAGKSSTIARLAGMVNFNAEYVETRGIRKSNIYWPVKVWDRIILFRLQCWDAGDKDVKKFGHILPVNNIIDVRFSLFNIPILYNNYDRCAKKKLTPSCLCFHSLTQAD